MRKLTVNTFLTTDGVMQAPGAPDEDPSGGFSHGGWSVQYWDDQMRERMGEFMGKPFALLLGRKTYEIFAAFWPRRTDDPTADALNGATKYVASKTLESVDWQKSELLRGDVAKAVAQLKRGEGPEIQVHGSGNLIKTLLQHDLIDEFHLWVFPLVLGSGKRLFGDGTTPTGLQVRDSLTSSTGVLITTYVPGGEIHYGSFAEEPAAANAGRR